MSRRKVKVEARVRLNAYEVLSRAVEQGVAYGVKHAQKHWPKQLKPEQSAAIEDEVCRAVRGELCDVLLFEEKSAE